MAAHIVFTRERLRDAAVFASYGEKAGGTPAGHVAKPLVASGANETLEGAPIEGAVIVEFPDMAAAKAWYNSPAYQEVVKLRFASSDYRVFIAEGL